MIWLINLWLKFLNSSLIKHRWLDEIQLRNVCYEKITRINIKNSIKGKIRNQNLIPHLKQNSIKRIEMIMDHCSKMYKKWIVTDIILLFGVFILFLLTQFECFLLRQYKHKWFFQKKKNRLLATEFVLAVSVITQGEPTEKKEREKRGGRSCENSGRRSLSGK